MSRNFFGIEKGLDLFAENGNLQVRFLSGTAVPDGLLDQSVAPIGSVYVRSGIGEFYQKISNLGNANDWKLANDAAVTIGKWRGQVKVATNDTIIAGTRSLVTNPFSDDNGVLLTAAEFVIGDFAIGGAGTTPVLFKVTAVVGGATPSVTFALADYPLANEDTFMAKNYLPDPDQGENKAIVNFNGTILVKVSDIDWSLATGINLSATYAAASGNPLAGDTIESALQKIDGNVDALNTLTGVSQGGTNYGAWAAPVDLLFSATASAKALFQRIGDLLMQLRGTTVAGITLTTMVDQVPVASVKAVKWFVEAFEIATPANRQAFEVYALNNTLVADDTISAKLKVGATFNLTTTIDVNAGNMRLMCASTSAGVTVTARRVEVVKSVL